MDCTYQNGKALVVEEYLGRLYIAVDDVVPVQVLDTDEHAGDDELCVQLADDVSVRVPQEQHTQVAQPTEPGHQPQALHRAPDTILQAEKYNETSIIRLIVRCTKIGVFYRLSLKASRKWRNIERS